MSQKTSGSRKNRHTVRYPPHPFSANVVILSKNRPNVDLRFSSLTGQLIFALLLSIHITTPHLKHETQDPHSKRFLRRDKHRSFEDNAKCASASAAQCIEEILVLASISRAEYPVGSYNLVLQLYRDHQPPHHLRMKWKNALSGRLPFHSSESTVSAHLPSKDSAGICNKTYNENSLGPSHLQRQPTDQTLPQTASPVLP